MPTLTYACNISLDHFILVTTNETTVIVQRIKRYCISIWILRFLNRKCWMWRTIILHRIENMSSLLVFSWVGGGQVFVSLSFILLTIALSILLRITVYDYHINYWSAKVMTSDHSHDPLWSFLISSMRRQVKKWH
jgi:hypothetical protein